MTRRMIIACLLACYLYAGLGVTAVALYELYHLVEIDPIYWAYGAFKAADYYFGIWKYQLHTCIGIVALVVLIPVVRSSTQKVEGEST